DAVLPSSILVEGHTANLPSNTPAFPSNWELTAARAASVVHLFMRQGIAPERLAVIGLGEYRPVATNETPEGRNANRRVVLVILSPDVPPEDLADDDRVVPNEPALDPPLPVLEMAGPIEAGK